MRSFSLDWNCVIEVENGGEHASHLHRLVELHRSRACDVSVLATSASENLRGSRTLPGSYALFRKRLEALGWSDLAAAPTTFTVGLTFIGSSRLAGEQDKAILGELWRIIAPKVERDLQRHLPEGKAHAGNWVASRHLARWRNAWCDVNSIHSHVSAKRDVFVTTNTRDFQKNAEALLAFGVRCIALPEEAVVLAEGR